MSNILDASYNLGSLNTINVLSVSTNNTLSNNTIWDPNTKWQLINIDPNNPQNGGQLTFDGGNTCLSVNTNSNNHYNNPSLNIVPCSQAIKWGIPTNSSNILASFMSFGSDVSTYTNHNYLLALGSNGPYINDVADNKTRYCLNGNTNKCTIMPQIGTTPGPTVENYLIDNTDKLYICSGNIITKTGPYVSGNGGCPLFMTNYCTNNWDTSTQIGNQCDTYLSSGIDTKQTINNTIINYLNNNKNPPSFVSSRDTNDPFLTSTLPYLCSTNNAACDPILNQYCFNWQRSDLQNNSTLQKLCGCHMANCQGNSSGCSSPPPQAGLSINNPSIMPDQYYGPGSPNTGPLPNSCDPICRFAATVQNGGFPACNSTVCVMDAENINVGTGSSINIQNLCNGNNPSNCYISVQAINATDNNKISIQNNCTSCYTYDETNPAAATQVDCNNIPGFGGNNNNNNNNNFINKIITFIQNNKILMIISLVGIFLIIFILALLI